jgi:4-alpha-glucanotransferase
VARTAAASFVTRAGVGVLWVHVVDGHDVTVTVALEDGSERVLTIPEQRPAARLVDGILRWRVEVPVPDDLPLGWHTVRAEQRPFGGAEADRTASAPFVITPDRLGDPPARGGRTRGGASWRSCTRCARAHRGASATSPISPTSRRSRASAAPTSC